MSTSPEAQKALDKFYTMAVNCESVEKEKFRWRCSKEEKACSPRICPKFHFKSLCFPKMSREGKGAS